jgi:hypothetical protein
MRLQEVKEREKKMKKLKAIFLAPHQWHNSIIFFPCPLDYLINGSKESEFI